MSSQNHNVPSHLRAFADFLLKKGRSAGSFHDLVFTKWNISPRIIDEIIQSLEEQIGKSKQKVAFLRLVEE